MKKRIIGATLITVVCALLISNLVGVLLFRSREMDAARNTLQELLVLMDAQSAITDPDGLAQQFHAAAPDKRLTIIDTDGTVLADTEANPQTLEDHNSRPEVEQAAATGWGEAVRHSETLGTSMLYVSKRFADGMVGRASMPLSSNDSLVCNGVWGFLIASAAGLLLALILARRTANRVVAPLSAVGSALQSVLDGTRASGLEDYQADDELRPILRYIDKLMERLGGYIQSITAERDKVGLILDCMDEGLILLDEAGNVLAINRAARTLFGFPEGEEDDGALLLTRSRRLREAMLGHRKKNGRLMAQARAWLTRYKIHPVAFLGAGCAVAAVAVFCSLYTIGTTVTYNGEVVGTVDSRASAEAARTDLEQITTETLGETYTIDDSSIQYSSGLMRLH